MFFLLKPIGQFHQTPRFSVEISRKEFAQSFVYFTGSIFLGHCPKSSLNVFGILQTDTIGIDLAVQVIACPLCNALAGKPWIQVLLNGVFDRPFDATEHLVANPLVLDDRLPTLIEIVALVVHDFVVFQNVLSNQEVAFFHFFWEREMDPVNILACNATPSFIPVARRMLFTRSDANMAIKSSSRDR